MKFAELFAGIGGMTKGLEDAGHECILHVENDPYCQRVLAKHWPDVRCIADVKEVTADDCKEADAIVGGFPCQPVSLAGRRQAQADSRWLWPEFNRIIAEVRPDHVIMENVPGLLDSGMGEVLGDLSALGYDAWWGRIAAASVGAPHLRWRIFIVAYTDDSGAEWGLQQSSSSQEERSLDSRWGCQPRMDRVAYGVPCRVDRLRVLGNAVVPQVAEIIGRMVSA